MLTYFTIKPNYDTKSIQTAMEYFIHELNETDSIKAAVYSIAQELSGEYSARTVVSMSGTIQEYQTILDYCKVLLENGTTPCDIDKELSNILIDLQSNEGYLEDALIFDAHSVLGEGPSHLTFAHGSTPYNSYKQKRTLKNLAEKFIERDQEVSLIPLSEGLKTYKTQFESLNYPLNRLVTCKKFYRDSKIVPLSDTEDKYISLVDRKIHFDENSPYFDNYENDDNFVSPLKPQGNAYTKGSSEYAKCLFFRYPIANSGSKKIFLLEGSPFRYMESNPDVPFATREDCIALKQLQYIHASFLLNESLLPSSGVYYFPFTMANEESKLRQMLRLSENSMLIVDVVNNNSLFIHRNDWFINLLREFKDKVQIILLCQTADMLDEADCLDITDISKYPQLFGELEQLNLPVYGIPEDSPESKYWTVESIQELQGCSEAEAASFLRFWKTDENKYLSLKEISEKKANIKQREESYRAYNTMYINLKSDPDKAKSEDLKALELIKNIFEEDDDEGEFEILQEDWDAIIEKFGTDYQPNLLVHANILSALSTATAVRSATPHIAICGNTGSGKSMTAKMLASFLYVKDLIPCAKPIIYSASNLIGQFQGHTSARVAKIFADAVGHVLIIEGLDNLLHQNDYGEQALEEIGIQMESCSKSLTVIITCEENALAKIIAKVPSIGTKLGRTIQLKDYSKPQLEQIIVEKLKEKMLDITNIETTNFETIKRAFEKLQEEHYSSQLLNHDALKFNLTSNVHFSDIIGNEDAKEELQEIVAHLGKNDGFNLPKGILLYGAPGTGKTLLAKAFANEAHIPYCSVPISYFTDRSEDGAERVQTLFAEARKRGRCVIFIDELESIVPSRERTGSSSPILSQLLAELDGFALNSGIIILAATNHPEQIDPAVLRSGRFDRKIHIELPNRSELVQLFKLYIDKATKSCEAPAEPEPTTYQECLDRYIRLVAGGDSTPDSDTNIGLLLKNGYFAEDVANAIFESNCLSSANLDKKIPSKKPEKHQPKIALSDDIDELILSEFAEKTTGCSSATIKSIVDKAVNLAIVAGTPLNADSFREAIAKLSETPQAIILMTTEDKLRTAYHEIGHAVCAIVNPLNVGGPSKDVSKVSIIPHSDYLGVTMIDDASVHTTKESLEHQIAILLAGRAMEEIVYGENNVSCGCSSDMQRASNIIYEMITVYGFNTRVGLLPFDLATCTDATKQLVYLHGDTFLKDIYEKTKAHLQSKRDLLDDLAKQLVEKQEIPGDELCAILK